MFLLLYAVLGILVLVLVAAVALVATPVHLGLRAEFGERKVVTLDIRPFGGLCPRIRLHGRDLAGQASVPKPPRDRKTPQKMKKKSARSRLVRRVAGAMPGLIRSELSRIHVDRLHLHLNFGTGDPADTGRLYGRLMPLVHGFPIPALTTVIHPDFTEARFDGCVFTAIHLTPASLAWPVLRAIVPAIVSRP